MGGGVGGCWGSYWGSWPPFPWNLEIVWLTFVLKITFDLIYYYPIIIIWEYWFLSYERSSAGLIYPISSGVTRRTQWSLCSRDGLLPSNHSELFLHCMALASFRPLTVWVFEFPHKLTYVDSIHLLFSKCLSLDWQWIKFKFPKIWNILEISV